MTPYVRPPLGVPVFRDVDGQVIRYGERWRGRGGMPLEDSYSVTSNLERFQPLHTVAEALIAHLTENFDVAVSDDVAHAAELLHTRTDIIRAVRLTPSNPDGAPVTFVLTSFPSVIVVAGAVTQLLFPNCGCDACDEVWDREADELEWQVLAVAAGDLREHRVPGVELRFQSALSSADGSASRGFSDILTDLASAERLARASDMLAAYPNGWGAWSARR